jgi:hypothetical protein
MSDATTDAAREPDPSPVRDETPPASPPTAAARDRWSEPVAATPAKSARGGVGLLTVTVFSLASALGGAWLALFVQSEPELVRSAGLGAVVPLAKTNEGAPAEDLRADLAALRDRFRALETRLAAGVAEPAPAAPQIAQAPGPQAPASPASPTAPAGQSPAAPVSEATARVDLGAIRAELQGIGGRVTAIETRLAALDPTGSGGAVIAALQTEIANLRAGVQAMQGQLLSAPPPGVTLAVVSLAEAASRPGPFLPEFESVRAALPGLPEVAALEPLARAGAPTRAILQERYAALEPAVAAMARTSTEEGGILAWFGRLVSDMIKIAPARSADATGPLAILSRGKTKLDQGDLQGAVEEVAAVAPAPDEVREWLTGARRRLELESRVAALRGAIERGGARPQAATPALAPPPPAPLSAPIPTPPPATAPASPAAPGPTP